ncbi:hypothetical protein ACJRO7_019418 [Eucalyptus globulus]|uniref:Germin-like protein n=1 Tax=Eucalyptus globulus TaxID=34317 RepID=A0ABD3KDB9_EUCGL
MEKLSSLIACALILAIAKNPIFMNAGDPDILKDFPVPPSLNKTTITRQYFTFTNFSKNSWLSRAEHLCGQDHLTAFRDQPTAHAPAVSRAPDRPGRHTRGRFRQHRKLALPADLQAHDLFIFPKGLVHFQVNTKPDCKAVALGVLRAVSIPATMFGSGIDV